MGLIWGWAGPPCLQVVQLMLRTPAVGWHLAVLGWCTSLTRCLSSGPSGPLCLWSACAEDLGKLLIGWPLDPGRVRPSTTVPKGSSITGARLLHKRFGAFVTWQAQLMVFFFLTLRFVTHLVCQMYPQVTGFLGDERVSLIDSADPC